MRVLLSTTAPSPQSALDARFGRASCYLIVDPATGEWQALDNPGGQAQGGAGIQAAQIASSNGCTAVISGDFGPNAFEALQAAGIPMYLYGTAASVEEALKRFQAGQLDQVGAPTNSGSHSR